MSYFLVTHPLQTGAMARIEGAEAKHLLVRRIKTGEKVELQDPSGSRYLCQVKQVTKKEVLLNVLASIAAPEEYTTRIILHQALIAEQTLDMLIQKTTELGVNTINIFKSDYSPSALQTAKLPRWQRISNEAAKQCGRSEPAKLSIGEFAALLKERSMRSSFYLSHKAPANALEVKPLLTTAQTIHLYIGPEGGWSESETKAFTNAGIQPLLLTRFTLRAETAAISALAQLALFVC